MLRYSRETKQIWYVSGRGGDVCIYVEIWEICLYNYVGLFCLLYTICKLENQGSLWCNLVGVWRPENQSSWCYKSQSEEQRRLDEVQCPSSISEAGNGANSSFLYFLFNRLDDAQPHWDRNSTLLTLLVLSGNILTATPRNNVNLNTHGSLKWTET